MTWLQTHSGKAFDLADPRADQVDFNDIGAHLAKLCRFVGASQVLYSVAQHSCLVCDLLPVEYRAWGLLHDAHEAYLGDWSQPLKTLAWEDCPDACLWLNRMEASIAQPIHEAAGLFWPNANFDCRKAVKSADLVMLMTERRDFLARPSRPWADDLEAIPLTLPKLKPWGVMRSWEEFMARMERYVPGAIAHQRRLAA